MIVGLGGPEGDEENTLARTMVQTLQISWHKSFFISQSQRSPPRSHPHVQYPHEKTFCSVFAPFADENRLLRLAFAPTQCESLYLNKTKNATPMEAVPKTVFRMRI